MWVFSRKIGHRHLFTYKRHARISGYKRMLMYKRMRLYAGQYGRLLSKSIARHSPGGVCIRKHHSAPVAMLADDGRTCQNVFACYRCK